jgi:hypothetical protein
MADLAFFRHSEMFKVTFTNHTGMGTIQKVKNWNNPMDFRQIGESIAGKR